MNTLSPSTMNLSEVGGDHVAAFRAHSPRVVDELVINWHVTEACNYKCTYCYAHWEQAKKSRDLVRSDEASLRLVGAIWNFFRPDNSANPLKKHLRWSKVRLNIAGGEPLIYRRQVARIAAHAKSLGMRVSMITNGSLFAEPGEEFNQFARSFDMIGFSVDSVSEETNIKIGRVGRSGAVLSVERFNELAERFRAANPGITIKVNTVVNKFNAGEDMRVAIDAIRPDRWKIFRVLPVINDDVAVSAADFSQFVSRNAGVVARVSVEDNRDMLESYIMVDPVGRFFQNGAGAKNGYEYSLSINEENIAQQFLGISFDSSVFASRY